MGLTRTPLSPTLAEAAAALHAASGMTETWDAAAFAQLLAMHGVCGEIITAGNGPAGLILWRIVADEAEIFTIVVAPSQRRKGLARMMIEDACAIMRENGVSWVFLEVAIDNTSAKRLYEGVGFQQRGRRPGYYADSGDALILARRIVPGSPVR